MQMQAQGMENFPFLALAFSLAFSFTFHRFTLVLPCVGAFICICVVCVNKALDARSVSAPSDLSGQSLLQFLQHKAAWSIFALRASHAMVGYPSIKFAVTHLYTSGKTGTMRVNCLPKNRTQCQSSNT